MALLQAPPRVASDLEARVEAFERSIARDGTADLADFLPPIDDPLYRLTLGELIRVEIELLWARGAARPVESYLARFPLLQNDPALLGAVAFEEFRQRLQAGEDVAPDEYRRHFGLDMAHWPAPDAGAGGQEMQTNALDWDEMRGAIAPGRTAAYGAASDTRVTLPSPGDLVLRRFRIRERLGRGAFGSVFLAERLDLFNRPVALKFLPGPSVEPAVLAQLIHENIVPIESVDRFGTMLAICMPYRGRTTLQHIIDGLPRTGMGHLSTAKMFFSTMQERSVSRASGAAQSDSNASQRPPVEKTGIDPQFRSLSQLDKLMGMSHVEASLRIVLGIANGLRHAHEHNIVHRDLKPANILLADDGTPMILDFNLAVQTRKDRPLDCIRMGGTFPYMAPEQIQSARDKVECRDPRSDLYSLGVVMFEMLTGRSPFPKTRRVAEDYLDQMLAARRRRLPDPCRFNSGLSRSVADIIHKLLAFDPAQRYQSARELKEDLERELTDRPLQFARESSPRARLAKFRRRHPRLSTALAAVVLLFLPLGTITGLKYQTYLRVKQRETAEALVKFDGSLRTCYEAQTLAHSRNKDSRLLQIGIGKAAELARSYAIDSDAEWATRGDVARLDDEHRKLLLDNLGATFQIVAEATAHQADAQLAGQADHWKRLAENCFGKSGRPGALAARPHAADSSSVTAELARLSNDELYQLATDLIAEPRFRQASIVLQELTRRDPKNFMAWFWRATCSDNLGDDPSAAQAWTVCTALQPEFAVCHYNLGLAQMRLNRHGDAERSFSDAYRLDNGMTNALASRAMSRMRQKNFDAAEADLTLALERDANWVPYRFLRSQVRRHMGKPFLAAADEAVGLGQEPGDEWGYSMRGWARLCHDPARLLQRPDLVQADLKQALADFDRALAINPRNRTALNNKAVALERLNRLPEAIEAWDTYLKEYPDTTPVHATRGVLLARLGDVDAAIGEAQLCLKSPAADAMMYYRIGSLYAAAARHDARYQAQALPLLQRALAHGLDRPDLFWTDTDLQALQTNSEFRKLVGFAQASATIKCQQLTRR